MHEEMSIKKIIGKIHLWLGLASGLVVFIVSITGSLYVFVDELRPLLYKDKLEIEAPSKATGRVPISEILDEAASQLTLHPIYIIVPNKPNATIEVQSWGENPDAWFYLSQFPDWETVFINPYNGKTVAKNNNGYDFFSLVLITHFTLLLDYELGTVIVGISTLVFVVMLITGLILWWPKNKAASKQRFWFRWKKTTKSRRKNYDLHNIAGFYMMLFALLIALTGLVFAFKWMDNSVQWIANGGNFTKSEVTHHSEIHLSGLDVDELYSFVQTAHPDAHDYTLGFDDHTFKPRYITARMHEHHRYESINYQIDSLGKVTQSPLFSEKTNGEKIKAMNYDIHVGSILGFPGKILAFFASLVSASLPVTGFMIWWGRKKKKKPIKYQ